MIEIKIYPDGDKTCAIIGDMPETVCIGFGDTARDAIVSMLDEMDRYETCTDAKKKIGSGGPGRKW